MSFDSSKVANTSAMYVRPAQEDDRVGIRNVLDGGLLSLDGDTLETALSEEFVLVAVESEDGGPILGALVVADAKILAIAVRRRRRGQGIGAKLVEAALNRCGCLCAEFHERVYPFWDALGFSIETLPEDDRYRGTLTEN